MDQQHKAEGKGQAESVPEQNRDSVSQKNDNSESIPVGHDHHGDEQPGEEQQPTETSRRAQRSATKKRGLSQLQSSRSHMDDGDDDSQGDE